MREKTMVFEDFAKKALKRIEEKKKFKTKLVRVKDLDLEIKLRGLTNQEIIECTEYSDEALKNDYYTIYYASETLQELAKYMVEKSMIKEHCMVCEMFRIVDRNKLVNIIMELSGAIGATSIEEVNEIEEIKN